MKIVTVKINIHLSSWKSRFVIVKISACYYKYRDSFNKFSTCQQENQSQLFPKIAFNILIIFCCKACKRSKKLSQLSYVASLFFVFDIFKSERLRSQLELRQNLEEIWVYKILFFEPFIVIVKDKMKYPYE